MLMIAIEGDRWCLSPYWVKGEVVRFEGNVAYFSRRKGGSKLSSGELACFKEVTHRET